MKPTSNYAPVFALDDFTTWDDLEDAMTGAAQYQSSKLGKITPLMFFAPMTVPKNPDAWEPMTTMPLNLMVVSISRPADAVVQSALERAGEMLGEEAATTASSPLAIDFEAEIGSVLSRMTETNLRLLAHLRPGRDDASFFFIRGGKATRAFDGVLREVTRGQGEGG